ncbi:pyruvate, phosphate dikinase [Thermodesulfobacteriota bacterium]
MSDKKYVYFFGAGEADGRADLKNLLGGKGANLAEMTSLNIPVPSGFTISTEVCSEYYENDENYPEALNGQVLENIKKVEAVMGRKFGDAANPLLLSVRSGARISMPGMMDTVLNLGLNDTTVQGLISNGDDGRFAYDSYRRFIQMYSDVVMGVDKELLEHILTEMKKDRGVESDTDLTAADLKELVEKFKAQLQETANKSFPEDPYDQLWGAIDAVFGSWNNKRAITYRRLNKIPGDWGTAVNVQSMVYGNMGDDCATGVAFTRDPATGENRFFGEFLLNAQGEDVVAGIRTPQPISIAGKGDSGLTSLEETMPEAYEALVTIYKKLEDHYRDMQDIEFTIQQNKLWMLQTRTGKRTIRSSLRIAVEMVAEGMITEEEAVLRVDPARLDQLLHPMIDPKATKNVLAKGLPASPGAACGKVVFTADEAEEMANNGEKVILVRIETSPEDIHGMHAAQGILTARGGMTSHAAVVARGMGKCCVAGCGDLKIKYDDNLLTVNGTTIKKGDVITIDGGEGEVMIGELPTIKPEISGDFAKLMTWADKVRSLNVRANADTPHDAKVAREFGAEGIGLCRTEHMFFDGDRIDAVREMILAEDLEGRKKALAKILPMQKGDFIGIFEEMKGLPVTIRLLDPPLHEFLPHSDADIAALGAKIGVSAEKLKSKVESLHEFNPMLGHRGCRLGIIFPEIYDMQVRAIMEAACELSKKGQKIVPEIMIPLVGLASELKFSRACAEKVCQDVIKECGEIEYLIGTMIELPRAALTADEIAKHADFYSFGTNDLTQTTFGLSRDDAGTFLPKYVEMGLLKEDPFVALDASGVGQLVEMGVQKGRSVKPNLKVGICGEHGGEPSSVEFCHNAGLNYVSCSPYRVPVARLSAAHAKLKEGK